MTTRTERQASSNGSFVEVTDSSVDSIELHRSSKGEYSWTIKVYHAPGKDSEALERLGTIDAQLQEDYLEAEGS